VLCTQEPTAHLPAASFERGQIYTLAKRMRLMRHMRTTFAKDIPDCSQALREAPECRRPVRVPPRRPSSDLYFEGRGGASARVPQAAPRRWRFSSQGAAKHCSMPRCEAEHSHVSHRPSQWQSNGYPYVSQFCMMVTMES